ncbi:MAG: hypothetical protein SGCHY_001543 [Lobulomycetales sp.]
MEAQIEDKLKASGEFDPIVHVKVEATSVGYELVIVSPVFEGMNTLKKHRFINKVLKDEIASIHAFSQKSYTPEQWEALSK